MPTLKMYDLFISHAWRYHEEYDKLVKMLNSASNFTWRNYSVPRHDPTIDPNTDAGFQALKRELDKQIRPVNCVVIISGMYAAHRRWIQVEMDIAKSYPKPMIGIRPWGQERAPQEVQEVVKEMVGWNTDSIVDAIRKCSI